jgi:hypothetical protein
MNNRNENTDGKNDLARIFHELPSRDSETGNPPEGWD